MDLTETDRSWTAAAGALLEPDERLLAAEEIDLASGVTPESPPEPGDGTSLSLLGKVGNLFLHLLSPNITLPGQNLVDVLLIGRAAAGPPGSHAEMICTALSTTRGHRRTVLAVTDRRLLVCVSPETPLFSLRDVPCDRVEPLRTVPRAAVTGAVVRRYRVRRRLRITFGDGSWAAFVTPFGSSLGPARRLAAALTT